MKDFSQYGHLCLESPENVKNSLNSRQRLGHSLQFITNDILRSQSQPLSQYNSSLGHMTVCFIFVWHIYICGTDSFAIMNGMQIFAKIFIFTFRDVRSA